jgi:hypothetical protein
MFAAEKHAWIYLPEVVRSRPRRFWLAFELDSTKAAVARHGVEVGDEAALDRIRPLLAPWTSGVHHLGPLGSGQAAKTVNNLIHWGQISAITEALRLGEAYGLDVPTVRRSSPVSRSISPHASGWGTPR